MKRRTKRIIFIPLSAILALLIFLLYFWGREYFMNYYFKMKLSNIVGPKPGEKVLVIAPHCDDETLGPGEIISRMVKENVDFKIVLMTNGDGFTDALDLAFHEIRPDREDYVRFGYKRQGETLSAMEFLGLSQNNIIFLGYPDGGLYNMWSAENWAVPYESLHTGASSSPYTNSYSKSAPYTGMSVVNDLRQIISDYKPDYVIYPHPNDRHHDHLASYCYTRYVLTQLGLPVKEYLYLVHRGDWPAITRNSKNLYLVPPPTLVNKYSNWLAFNLSEAEIKQKGEAILKYSSQVHVMGAKLLSFDRKNELFATYSDGTIKNTADNSQNVNFKNYYLISDPTGDVLLSRIHGSGDLKALYGYKEMNGNMKFYIETRSKILPDVRYIFDIMLFSNSTSLGRISISTMDSKPFAVSLNGSTEEEVTDIPVSARGKLLEISIPGKYVKGANRCFIGITSSVLGMRLDNMAWRMYTIE